MTDVDLDEGVLGLIALFDPNRIADPYPTFARLRATRPIWRVTERLIVLSRHEDCARVLRDLRFGHAEADQVATRRPVVPGMDDALTEAPPVRSFLGLDPPDHTRLRRLVSRAFTPSRVTELAPRIEELVADLVVDVNTSRGEVDLIAALASPLPVTVISELLGIPFSDREQLVGWSDALARGLDPAFLLPASVRAGQQRAREEFTDYLAELITERRHSPGDDLLSALVGVQDGSDLLSDEELIATCILLLIAGHETTTSLIGTGVLSLLRHPEQLARLRDQPSLIHVAVEEMLRYDSPVQLTARYALADAEVGGVIIPEGSFVLLLIGAANRDPDLCVDPDSLDVGRPPSHHLAFGQGIHFCLGAPLARLEAQIALSAVVQSGSELRLASEPEWKENSVLRGLRRLVVTVS